MPYSLSERLGPYGRRELDDTIHQEPSWWLAAGIASAFVVAAMAVMSFLTARDYIRSPATFAALLGVATVPWIIQLRVKIPEPLWDALILGPLAAQNFFGDSLGVWDPHHGRDQLSLLILVWLVGATASVASRTEVVIVSLAATTIAGGRQFTDTTYGSGAIWVIGILIALVAGLFIRSLTVALLNTKMAEAALQEQAATDERQRIAREVHDVIAHSMTVTMLHLTAARLAVGRGDTAAATEALEEAERAGRTSLNEIRHTVGLLRTDDTNGDAAPLPSAIDIPSLVEGYRAAGMAVALEIDGDLQGVAPAIGLALYRIVQESLTNAGRHAPGAPCMVTVAVGPPAHVEVRNEANANGTTRGGGMGLMGMTERAHALGGSMEAGIDGDMWRVAATIP